MLGPVNTRDTCTGFVEKLNHRSVDGPVLGVEKSNREIASRFFPRKILKPQLLFWCETFASTGFRSTVIAPLSFWKISEIYKNANGNEYPKIIHRNYSAVCRLRTIPSSPIRMIRTRLRAHDAI